MKMRLQWLIVGVCAGLVSGGVAFAVVVNPPNSTDRYYACVSSSGVVRADSMTLNSPPTKCRATTDQVRAWNAVGATGPTGASGVMGPTGATGPPAPRPAVRVIKMAQSYSDVGSRVSFGPVDASDCRRISIHVAMTVPQSMLIRAYTGRSTTETGFGLIYSGYGSLGSSGVVVFPPAQPMGALMFTVEPGGYLSMPAAYIMCETLPQPNRVIELSESYPSVGAGGTVAFGNTDVSGCSDVAFFAETPGSPSGYARLYSALPPPEPIVGSVAGGSADGIGGVVGYFPDPYLPMSNTHFTLTVGSATAVNRAWLLCTPF